MITRISDLARSNHGHLTNLSETVLSFTSSLICGIAFGKKIDGQEESEIKKFHELTHEAEAMLGGLFVSDYLPSFSWVDKLSGMATRLKKTFQNLDSFYQELIDEHLKPSRSKSTNKDILDLLIQLKEQQSCAVELTLDHIKAVLMNIFIAGTDTSAATIIWAMTSLIKNPNAMKNVQAEIRYQVGNKGRVDKDDLEKLPYLKAVIKESFRLYPPVPLLVPRETMKSCIIEGYEIQPRTLVYINAWGIARDPEYWENPMEFWPERFLNSAVDNKGQDFGLIPFGSGRRNCPGMSLGLVTVELALADLLYSFDWELPSGMKAEDIDSDVLPGITVHKKNALCHVPRNYLCT
ncbi:Cytochrome P450 CYP2 subfamily [Olea europaea subsp. europaea]|uniref:Cytochrome P450 CYP2 subfamily n=1 Tax=Olea europaea subsp. europaea TaxID=158383 RepID=A0A8S0UAN1_OLEEU|nr:Cytochrome P450 CYP2 subfamily [Olea europaea subsp. europaea]